MPQASARAAGVPEVERRAAVGKARGGRGRAALLTSLRPEATGWQAKWEGRAIVSSWFQFTHTGLPKPHAYPPSAACSAVPLPVTLLNPHCRSHEQPGQRMIRTMTDSAMLSRGRRTLEAIRTMAAPIP